jgi:XTP/dITP diphosphohydrolase
MQTRPLQLLVATHNQGKLREFRALFGDAQLEVMGLDRFKNVVEVQETGSTFSENAALKAGGYAAQTGTVTLADDSGLEVEVLDGRPGLMSARYGETGTTFDQKMSMLLGELDKTGDKARRARFVAAMAIADETGHILHAVQAICTGTIAAEPRGDGGFGYDPVFIPDGYDRTFGELPDTVKRQISHRGRAFSQIMPFLRGFFAI